MVDSVKITALQDIGANIAYTTLVPVVNMSGTPTTQKANLQILGNLILSSAGGPNFVPAAQAINAQTVSNAAQPAITSVGTLTSLAVLGNVTSGNANLGNLVVANFFSGDGSLLTNISISYSNNDVANYLPTYTGNVGANWIIADYVSGNALPLFNIPGSNVSGTVPYAAVANNVSVANVSGIGNIATINLNGNISTVLRGDGTWGADATSTYGNSNVVSLLSSFGSNSITTTGVITGNGYGLSNVPYANITGTPILGNISSVNLTGSTSNVLYGNGVFAPPGAAGAGGGNTQIQFNANGSLSGSANLFWDSTYDTLYTPKISIANAINSSASQIGITPGALPNGQGPTWTFDSDGGLYWPASGGALWVIQPNPAGEFEFKSTSNIVISTDISNANSHFTFDSDGIFTAPSNVNLLGSRLNVGPDAANTASLLNPTLVIANSGGQFIQAAIINNDETGSSDWSADGAGGGDDEAWTDMGFAGYGFNDANYTITSPGDGYLFVQAYANGIGGNMVLATGENGNTADIIFATGGFLTSNEFARIDHVNSAFTLTRTDSFLKFAGTGSISNPANTSLDPINPNVSTMTLTPDANYSSQILVLDPTAPGHIHLRAFASSNIDEPSANIFLGGENTAFEVTQGANNVAKIHSGSNTWTFGNDGRLTFPGTPRIDTSADNFEVQAAEAINFEANTVVNIYTDGSGNTYQWQFGDDGTLTAPGDITTAGDITGRAAANTLILKAQPTTNTYIQLNSIVDSTIQTHANLEIVTDSSNTSQSWKFDATGNLTLPGNTIAINFADNSPAFGNMVEWTTAPTANTDPGTAGQAAYDSGGNLYVCVASNTWAKFAGTTSW